MSPQPDGKRWRLLSDDVSMFDLCTAHRKSLTVEKCSDGCECEVVTARTSVRELRLAEAAAAISGAFHGDQGYEEIYSEVGKTIGGFPGFWSECAVIAGLVVEHEEAGLIDVNGRHEWIDLVDYVVGGMFEHYRASGKGLTEEEMDCIVVEAIQRSECQ